MINTKYIKSLDKRFLIWTRESNVLHNNTLATLHYSSKLVKIGIDCPKIINDKCFKK